MYSEVSAPLAAREPIALNTTKAVTPASVDHITQSILILRGQRVLFDSELATLYEVPTKRLNEQV